MEKANKLCFMILDTHSIILLVLKSHKLHHRHRAWMSCVAKSKSLSVLTEKIQCGAIPGEGGCCLHLTELFRVFFFSLLLSPFYSFALIFLLIFLLTVSTYSTCKCENQCLHNLNQLKWIKANRHLPGWAEMENNLCPNSHTALQSPSCHTAGENGNKSEWQLRWSSATTPLLCAVISAIKTELTELSPIQTCGLWSRFCTSSLATTLFTLLLSLLATCGWCLVWECWP